ncbi:MAG TPA: MXAN_5187 C-terminal domain-containing protein [Kofleriaceae bacterium]|nr:MXAN_5187 C-terminal domain-containing protein [Kofleriaceae bacterium]
MSRTIIAGVVTILVLVLTATAYVVTSSQLESRVKRDVRVRVDKAQELLVNTSFLDSLRLLTNVESLARDENLTTALEAAKEPGATEAEVSARAELAFTKYKLEVARGEKIDLLAVLNASGDVVVLHLQGESVSVTNPGMWKTGSALKYPGFAAALDKAKPRAVSDTWNHEGQGLMRIGAAPIRARDGQVAGAVVVAYALGAGAAQKQSSMLGAEVAFFEGEGISATSFRRPQARNEEDTLKREALAKALGSAGLVKQALNSQSGFADPVVVTVDGESFVAGAGRFAVPSPATEGATGGTIGAVVLISLDDAEAPVGVAKVGILLVGLGAILIAVLALWFAQRRIVHQADQIEVGLVEIINGNLDYMFRPVGNELDGLANNLNVMLARLLGRPEPGEEEYDDDGNIINPNRLDFDTALSDKDEEAVKLAQEPESDYYKRIFDEYVAARASVGVTGDVTFDGFVTKLRINESSLTAKYQCSAIRFKVAVADGKVSLKPVPIV